MAVEALPIHIYKILIARKLSLGMFQFSDVNLSIF